MRTTLSRSSPAGRRVAGKGQLLVALVLLVGLCVLAFGFFEDNKVVLYAGLVVTLAGVLNGVIQILPRSEE